MPAIAYTSSSNDSVSNSFSTICRSEFSASSYRYGPPGLMAVFRFSSISSRILASRFFASLIISCTQMLFCTASGESI